MLLENFTKNDILTLINKAKKTINLNEIIKSLGIIEKKDKEELNKILEEFLQKKIIFKNKQNNYYLKFKNNLIGKVIISKKNYGFIKTDQENSYFIAPKRIKNVLNGDEVLFYIKDVVFKNEKKTEAFIIKILKRKIDILIGEVKINKIFNYKYLQLHNLNLKLKEVDIINPFKVKEGNIVTAKIIENLSSKYIKAKVINILGNNYNENGVDILEIINELNIKNRFNFNTLKEAKLIPKKITTKELQNESKKRKDIRKKTLVTIDGSDSKDFDDAIYVNKLKNNNYNLIVSIADVSYYVKKNSELDKEALKRGNSTYLIDRVIPMLPEKLSNGICSLNELKNRFSFVCEMEINSQGICINSKIYEAIMKSHQRLTYDQVNNFFNNKENKNKIKQEIKPMLNVAKELYEILQNHKNKLGIIDLDLKEPKYKIDDYGKIKEIYIKKPDCAEKLIENFMIKANEEISKKISNLKLPFIYRIHPKPKPEKIKILLNTLSMFGIDLKEFKNDIDLTPKTFQKLINKLKKLDNNQLTLTLFLKNMEKAIYSEKPLGHFGLASSYYSHFTSPIRRYSDLLAHRLIKEYLFKNNTSDKSKKEFKNFIKKAAIICIECEQKSLECEREVAKAKKSEYMEQFINEEFNGIITGITDFGIFVELENTIEGLIHISTLDDDHYIYNENVLKLIGENNKKIYSIGQKLKVKVKNANKINRVIDFIIA